MDRDRKFTSKDYLALGLALLLACCAWFIHNMSLPYSGLAQCSFIASCELDGRDNVSSSASEVAARLEMSGFDLAVSKRNSRRKPLKVEIASEDMHYRQGDLYYMAKDDLAKYFHEFFGADAKLEYFVTDTVFFRFPETDHRLVPVRLLSSIRFKPQYTASGQLRVIPDSVYVYGKKELLGSVDYVSTEMIDYSNVSSEIYGEIDLKPVKDLRLSARKVQFSLPVVRYVEQEITVEVKASDVPSDIDMQMMPATAVVRIRSVFPGILDTADIGVCVDFSEFEMSRSGKCVGRVTGLPEDVLGYSVEPQVFDCFIRNDY